MAHSALLTVISADTLAEQERCEEERQRELQDRQAQVEIGLAAHITRHWEINRRAKQPITTILEQCLRQRNGEYDPEDLALIEAEGGSRIYMNLTATKCRAAAAWLNDLTNGVERPFAFEPTPKPEIEPERRRELILRLNQELAEAAKAGVSPEPQEVAERAQQMEAALRDLVMQEATRAAGRMEDLVSDQLEEGGYRQAMMALIDDFVTYPAAILKGPIPRVRPQLRWGRDGQPVIEQRVVYENERVSPFDCYPSPGASSPQEGHFIEVVRFDPKDLYRMQGMPGYNAEAIRAVLEHGELGGELRVLARSLEYDRNRTNTLQQEDGLAWGLHYWGPARGDDLLRWGMTPEEVPDPLAFYEIEAIKIGPWVIKAVINRDPLLRRPYYATSWQKEPGSMWGKSLPQLMRDIQRMCNAAARALSNNMGVAAGPQIVVMKDLLPEGDGEVTGIYPLKVWEMVSDARGRQSLQPVYFFQPSSNANELLAVYNQFEAKADDATNIPRYAYGNERVSGAAATMGGLSMLLESASKAIKDAVRHLDYDITMPRVERQYTENMLYHDDPAVKGDLKVIARGAASLVAKASAQARRNEFLQIVGGVPAFSQLMGLKGFGRLLREMVRDMDMPETIVPDEEAIEQMEQQMAEAAQQQAQQQDPRLQVAQMNAEVKQQELQLKREIAQREYEAEMMRLALTKDMTLEQIKARLGEMAMKLANDRKNLIYEGAIKQRFGSGL